MLTVAHPSIFGSTTGHGRRSFRRRPFHQSRRRIFFEQLEERSLLASDVLYFSLSSAATVGGVSAANEDILGYDGGGFSKLFDGSDVGVAGLALDAIDVIGPSEILMSFSAAASIPGIGGTVDDSDVVKFTATELGDTTSGSFSLYFDGSTVGLTGSSEDVDAVSLLDDGRLVLSTTGSFGVTGTSGKDEDLAAFDPASGTWSLYFDGSDVGLASSSSEDVDAAGLDSAGNIYLSTTGSFDVAGVSGADEDVFVFSPTSLGSSTSGSFDSTLFFDGSAHGLSSKDIKGIDIPDAGPALPQLSIDDVQLTEGDSGTTTFVFTVTRSGDVSQQSTVNFSTAAGTATEGVDYVGTSGMLTFPAGDSNQQTIIVQVNGDTDVESNEIFFVDLSNATGGTISDNQGLGTISNDDSPPPTLSIADATVTEGDDSITFLDEFVTPEPGPSFINAGLDGLAIGPSDGLLYVSGYDSNNVLRFDRTTGDLVDEFVGNGSGGLDSPKGLTFGPDGNGDGVQDIYVGSHTTHEIMRYDGVAGAPLPAPGKTGAVFVSAGEGGLDLPSGITAGPDGNTDGTLDLYVVSTSGHKVLRFSGVDGSLIDTFVASTSGGLSNPQGLVFGPDNHLYVASFSNAAIMRYDGLTGTPLPGPNGAPGTAEFIPSGNGGLQKADSVAFGPHGNLYVNHQDTDEVWRFDGTTGLFTDVFVSAIHKDMDRPISLLFDAAGKLYVGSAKLGAVVSYEGPLDANPGNAVHVFTAPGGSGGLNKGRGVTFGPGGSLDLYVASGDSDEILRYDGATGAFLGAFVSNDPATPAIDETGARSSGRGSLWTKRRAPIRYQFANERSSSL